MRSPQKKSSPKIRPTSCSGYRTKRRRSLSSSTSSKRDKSFSPQTRNLRHNPSPTKPATYGASPTPINNQNANRYSKSATKVREASYTPRSSYMPYSVVRGFRPGEYYTRGTSIGGNTRLDGVGSVVNDIHAGDGYSWRSELSTSVPRIRGCSRFDNCYKSHCCPPRDPIACLESSSSESCSEDSSSEEEPCPPFPPCICKTYMETAAMTTDNFTMTECISRSQGTNMDIQTLSKSLATDNVTRDVSTEIEEEFFMDDEDDIQFSQRLSHMEAAFSSASISVKRIK